MKAWTVLSGIWGLCLIGMTIEPAQAIDDASPLGQKAAYFEHDLLKNHWLDGLYVSIVPHLSEGATRTHSVDEHGNVIHSGVWTGRYLAGVGYQYAVTRDPRVREHGATILKALRILQEVTGKPGLLARGYVKGHGPVADWERNGSDSREWHQGQGDYADYRWYGDVSVDNFNAVLYGYSVYYDLAADDEQKKFIARDVDRLMTHLLDNNCRIIDVDGEPTQYGHVGIDPDPARDAYYEKIYGARMKFFGIASVAQSPLRANLMLLPDLLIARRITGSERYLELYRRVVERFRDNPEPEYFRRPFSLERLARTDHSNEGQAYEALYNLVRLEQDPSLLAIYRQWVGQMWEMNWNEGNALFAYMTLALLPEYRTPERRSEPPSDSVPHAAEGLQLAEATLRLFPVDRVLRPRMNSLRKEIELNPHADFEGRFGQAAKPLPINERPYDNEYAWKGNPYRLDGWLKPTVTAMQFSCDDPQVAWFADSAGRLYLTLDRGQSWRNVSTGLMGAGVQNIAASKSRTFVLWARTGNGLFITRDGGLSWRTASGDDAPEFTEWKFDEPLSTGNGVELRINAAGELIRAASGESEGRPAMTGWRIPLAKSIFETPWGIIASGPGGAYQSDDGETWNELALWPEIETGAADYLHAYWMGRYYGFLAADDDSRR